MEKPRWLDFLSARLKSQISLENGEKAQSWALALLCLICVGFAFQAVGNPEGQSFLYGTKILFLIFFHLLLILGFYLPSLLQKGEKPLARLLGIKDFTGLMAVSLVLTFYTVVVFMLSHQTAAGTGELGVSNFFTFVAWTHFLFAGLYLLGCLFYFTSLFFFPNALVKFVERSGKSVYVFLSLHATFFFLLGFGYAEMAPIGSPTFFEQLRVAGLFWIFIVTSILLISQWLRESSVPALASLELEVASGKLERTEEILERFKEAFVLKRLSFWINRLSHTVATKGHEIAQLTHEAVNFVSREKPTEIDLRVVEERHRRADHVYKKLEKENQRFLVSLSLFELTDAERTKVEELRDQFSRELRNGKLELASVRQRIDERLVALKNQVPVQVPVEKIPAAPVASK